MNLLGSVILNAYPGNFPIDDKKITTLASIAKAVEARGDSAGDSLFMFLVEDLASAGESDDADAVDGLSPDRIIRALANNQGDVAAVRKGVEAYFRSQGIPFYT